MNKLINKMVGIFVDSHLTKKYKINVPLINLHVCHSYEYCKGVKLPLGMYTYLRLSYQNESNAYHITMVNVYVDLVVLTRIAGTS